MWPELPTRTEPDPFRHHLCFECGAAPDKKRRGYFYMAEDGWIVGPQVPFNENGKRIYIKALCCPDCRSK